MSRDIQKKTISIMQIVGDPVGGIRKHVHSIILQDNPQFEFSYAFSTEACDSRFLQDYTELTKKANLIPLSIKKKPHFTDVLNILKLIRHIRSKKIDILHGHGAKGGLYARILGRLCGIKNIYTPHGGSVHSMFSPLAEKVYTSVERCLFFLTDYFVFESEYTANAFEKKIQRSLDRYCINYNGISSEDIGEIEKKALKLRYTDQVIKVGVFGMLREQKGQVFAIRALAQLLSSGLKIQLHIFGDGPDRTILEKTAKSLDCGSSVIFHGDVQEAELHMFAMDIIVIPSRFESFGYVAVEAMSLQKPVIASKTGGLCEVIEHEKSGLLVPPGDEVQLANAIQYIIDNPDKSLQFAKNGYSRFQKYFTERRMLENLNTVYFKLSRT